MIRFNKDILVPVDFEKPSIHALKSSVGCAAFVKGRVHLLHVIEAGDFISKILESKDEVVSTTVRALDELNSLKNQYLRGSETDAVTRVETGKPYKKILEYAEKVDPSIIILGDNDPLKSVGKRLGPTNTQIITASKWPVITVKLVEPGIPRKIVIPLDLSFESTAQICNAIVLAKEYNSKVYLVSVVIGGIQKEESRIYSRLKDIQVTFERNDIKCEMKLYKRSEVPVYKRIIEFSNEVEADMIMILTHKESTTHDNYIGAVAHHIINEAPMPVLSLTLKAAHQDMEKLVSSIIDPFNIFKAGKRN
ncbi:MAG: universal stress protein [Bacteroidales bacterium]|nr:universal stress protein [Bacteroidales bacterium]